MGMIAFGRRRTGPSAAALHDAQVLRHRYGPNAEQWCEIGLADQRDETKRRALQDIRQALRQTPAS